MIHLRFNCLAATAVVQEPPKGSRIVSALWCCSNLAQSSTGFSVGCNGLEPTLSQFLKVFEWGGDQSDIKGLAFRKGEEVTINPPPETLPEMDTLPFPARHLLKNDRYYNVLVKRRNFTVMLSAMGCPFRCSFCDLRSRKFRMRSSKSFVDEIEDCYKNFGVRSIDIYDSSGRLIRTLHLGLKMAGSHTSKDKAAHWDGKDDSGESLASGVYFLVLRADDGFSDTSKMVLLE